jgi:Rad3-related DNA helicase
LTNSNPPPGKIFDEAKAEGVCPFEVQLELARHADVLVADYNYVFDPGSALMHLRDEGLRDAILVIDEAHNLPDRIRGIFSPALLESGVVAALEAAKLLKVRNQSGNKTFAEPSCQLDFAGDLRSAPSELSDMPKVLEQALDLIRQCAGQSLPADKDAATEILVPQQGFLTLRGSLEAGFLRLRRLETKSQIDFGN